ncbi:MAG TPA: methanol oxidation system protein MoxJ, partial [Hyphomicrobium sp.]|nr:methanol oxidation system protein MoxJ [Hyphomicrobium sp.]
MASDFDNSRLRETASRTCQVIVAAGVSLLAIAASSPSKSDAAKPVVAANPQALRVCSAAKELPYSADDESGFENKIAKALAEGMGRKIEFVWSQKPAIYAVRDQLDKNLCDVIIGTDTSDPRVLTSK